MRQSISMKYEGGKKIYLYSHWGGGETYAESPLAVKLHRALSRRERWDDEMYLARIITSEVLKENIDDETGYGIGFIEISPDYNTIKVDFENKTVDKLSFEEFVSLDL